MKFGLVDGEKVPATKGAKGVCPLCRAELIAKCGEVKINHWAHKSRRNCDPWWENETEWHRNWKNRYPESWQETVFKDANTGEKHIADVCTKDGLVLEFQHSHIKAVEQTSRESFYREMVWVVNGARRKTDYKRFVRGFEDFTSTNQQGIFFTYFPDECFHSSWINRAVPVFFDFEDVPDSNPRLTENAVWGLLPGSQQGRVIVLCVSKEQFVEFATNGNLFDKLSEINKFSTYSSG